MTSEQGSFGQADVQPRRGRIVARVLSSDLNITLLHKQAAERYGHLAKNESVTSTSACNDLCPPPWIEHVSKIRGFAAMSTNPVCEFAEHFSACSASNEVCKTLPVKFRCCPAHCVQSAYECYKGPPTNFLCVPKSIQPWMVDKIRLIVHGSSSQV
ncbi:uncharacterized protein LOC127834986 [Dreissena polymorpha]|nr:uncharacterized protein LOC127834986 [Dreissena polymorpha]